jgi:hypothetical protein
MKPKPAPSAAAAQEAAEIERQLDRLEGLVQQLKVAYQRFFNGDLPLSECLQIQDSLQLGLRALRRRQLQRAVDRFRLGGLEAQINSYSEMFGRRVRLLEEGRAPQPRRPAPAADYDVERGVVLREASEEGAVEALFKGLCERTGRAPAMDLGTFRSYLEKQLTQIRQKTGCGEVQFRLVQEEGKVKLKARPMGAGGAAP